MVLPNEPNFKYQSRRQKSFFAKQTQFSECEKCPNSFSYSWLLEAGGWKLSKKQTQTNPILIESEQTWRETEK
jgi:hypothetical protein